MGFQRKYSEMISGPNDLFLLEFVDGLTSFGYKMDEVSARVDKIKNAISFYSKMEARSIPGYIIFCDNSIQYCTTMIAMLLLGKRILVCREDDMAEADFQDYSDYVCIHNSENIPPFLKHSVSMRDLMNAPSFPGDLCEIDGEFELGFLTSGSNGTRRVIFHNERFILERIDEFSKYLSSIRFLASCVPLSHVYGFIFFFLTNFLNGKRLAIFSKYQEVALTAFLSRIEGLDLFVGTPNLLKLINLRKAIYNDFKKVKMFSSASALLDRQTVLESYNNFSFRIIPLYGMTETAGSVIGETIAVEKRPHEELFFSGDFVTVGNAFPMHDISIINQYGEEVEAEQVGEISIKNSQHNLNIKSGDFGYYKIDPGTNEKFYYITGRGTDIVNRYGEKINLNRIEMILHKWDVQSGSRTVAVKYKNSFSGENYGLLMFVESPEKVDFINLKEFIEKNISFIERPAQVIVLIGSTANIDILKTRRVVYSKYFEPYQQSYLKDTSYILYES